MKKKTRIVLNELKVQSFVTSLESSEKQTFRGGAQTQNDCYTVLNCGTILNSICRTCQFVCMD